MARTGSHRRLMLFGVAICLGTTAMLGFRAATRAEPRPVSIAVVDMFKLMNSLDELQQDKTELDAMRKRYQDEVDQDLAQIKSIESDLQELNMPDDEKFQKTIRRLELRSNANAKVQRSKLILGFEDNRRTIDRYNKLVEAAGALAKEQGYDLVMVRSDQHAFGALPDPAESNIDPPQLQDIMLLRQMLYVNDAIDITDQLIKRMNNEFKAGLNPAHP